jgi:hypothetical protein
MNANATRPQLLISVNDFQTSNPKLLINHLIQVEKVVPTEQCIAPLAQQRKAANPQGGVMEIRLGFGFLLDS